MESIKIQGIYFERKIMTAGVGATVRERVDDLHYYVRGLDDGNIRLEFLKVSQTEALFEEENKHVFNEFGIDLRKNGMYDEAIGNYEKAISIDPKDENLYYNLGRAYKETGDYKTAYEKVKKALELKPDFKEAQEYLEFLKNKASGK